MTITTQAIRGGALLPLAAAAFIALAGPATATPRFILKICDKDGNALIPGEDADPHRDWMEALAFGSSAQKTGSEQVGGVRAAVNPPPFPRPPVFAKASTGRPIRPNDCSRSLPPKANS